MFGKNWIFKKLLLLIMLISLFSFSYDDCYASTAPDGLLMGHATAYCVEGITKSGINTRSGICAGKEEWLGKTIILYQRLPDNSVGNVIGIYECMDTGGTEGLKNGKVIDIWVPDLDSAQVFMDEVYKDGCEGKVYMQILDAEG